MADTNSPNAKYGKGILSFLDQKLKNKVPVSELRTGIAATVPPKEFQMGLTWLVDNRLAIVSKKNCLYATKEGKKFVAS